MRVLAIICALWAATWGEARGGELMLASPATRTRLIELYTSEGCSSSPPADLWLQSLVDAPGLWSAFVPLAFHVDYWDDLGWADPFASRSNSLRQKELFRTWGTERVCTPCFAMDGQPWHPVGFPEPETAVAGALTVRLDSGEAILRFRPAVDTDRPRSAWLAFLSGPLSSQVTAGENAGRLLTHAFVVLEFAILPMQADGDAWCASARLTLPPQARAVAAWVSKEDSLVPEQATGGWLPAGARAP
jgi:hypothetical protein